MHKLIEIYPRILIQSLLHYFKRIITSVERAMIGLLLVVGMGTSSIISSTGAGSWTRCGLPLPLFTVLSSPFSSFGVTPKNRTGPLGNTWGNSGPSWWVRKLLESTRSKPGLGRFPRVRVDSVVPVLWFDRDLSLDEFNSYITRIEAAERSEMEKKRKSKMLRVMCTLVEIWCWSVTFPRIRLQLRPIVCLCCCHFCLESLRCWLVPRCSIFPRCCICFCWSHA